MARVLATVTFLFYVVVFGSCQNDTNSTTIEQDFWDMEMSYEVWLRAGCVMGSPTPTGRFTATLSSENGTSLAQVMRNMNARSVSLLVYDYATKNIDLSTEPHPAVGVNSPDGFLHYSAFKLNGSHFIASDLNGVELAIRTNLQPDDVWNVNLRASGADLLACLPRIDCGR